MKYFLIISMFLITIGNVFTDETLNNDEPILKEQETNEKLNLQQVEEMLQKLEKDQAKLIAEKNEDPTVKEALEKLFFQFRKLTSSYVDVLDAVNKNLGLPKYPRLPGMYRKSRGIFDLTPIRQIRENLSQLGTTISEVGQLISRVVVNSSRDSRDTIVRQFEQFTNLWSNQLNEISRSLQPNQPYGRMAEGTEQQQESVFATIQRHLSQLSRDIQNYVDNILTDIRNRLVSATRAPYPKPQLN